MLQNANVAMVTEFQEGIKLRKHKKAQNSKPLVQSKPIERKSPSVLSFGSYLDATDGPSQVR